MPTDRNDQQNTTSDPQKPNMGTSPVSDFTTQSNTPPPIPFSTEDIAEVPPPIIQGQDMQATASLPQMPSANEMPEEPQKKKFAMPKFGGGSKKRMIATILGIIILVGAVAAGVVLVQRQQDLRKSADLLVSSGFWNKINDPHDLCNGPDGVCDFCDAGGCDVGSVFPACKVWHYASDDADDPVVNDITIANGVQSANLGARNCGAEQIDVACGIPLTDVGHSWIRYDEDCVDDPPVDQCPAPVLTFTQVCNDPNSKSVTVNWNNVPGAETYRVQIDTSNTFPDPVTVSNLTTTTHTFPNVVAPGTTRYSHVQVQTSNNSCESPSDYSSPPVTIPGITCSTTNVKPTCTAFSILTSGGSTLTNSITIGDLVTVSATGSDSDGSISHIAFYWAKTGVDYCSNNGNNWTLIDDLDTNPATATWDTSELYGVVGVGESVQVVANVFDNANGWCTGNPGGTCGTSAASCPICRGIVTVTGSATPSPEPVITPTPPSATATPTAPPIGNAACGEICSSFTGIQCDTGLICDYSKTGITSQGICVIPECQNESCTCTPGTATIGGLCLEVKAYEVEGDPTIFDNWTRLTVNDLRNLTAADIVFFTVAGILTGDPLTVIDQGRFSVTDNPNTPPVWTVSNNIKPGEPATSLVPIEFYYEYTIPEVQKAFVIRGQVHDPRSDIWF